MSLLVLLLLASKADVMNSIVPDTASAAHIGQVITLDCNVANVKLAHNGMTFIDCGGAYANMQASLVVFAKDVSTMGDLEQYKGKHMLVHGKLQTYKGKPEIILESKTQIQSSR